MPELRIGFCPCEKRSDTVTEIQPRFGWFALQNFLRRSGKDHLAAVRAAAYAHFDDVVRLGDKFKAVFDDDDGVTLGDKVSEKVKQFFGILAVKSRRRLVKDIDRALFVQFAGKFDTLDFAARKRVGRLPERDVSYYAERLNVSTKYLSATVKRVTGHSVSSFIDRHTVPILKKYLNDERLSLTQIADRMNFTSLSYFSRYCTKHLGQSPSEYRRSLQPRG